MSPSRELWKLVRDTLIADTTVMAIFDDVFDKVPKDAWKGRQAYVSRGPTYGTDDGAECIDGQEITLQVDAWSKVNNTSSVSDGVERIRRALHERELQLGDNALVQIRVELWRIVDDPDPLISHGIIQVVAIIEVP